MAGLLDYLQAASNAAASNVSGPVDLINSGLLAAGLPMPRRPVLGSEWMASKGLTREVSDPYARLVGETAALSLPLFAAQGIPQRLAQSGKIMGSPGTSLASKSPSLLDPKPVPQRPFYDDYPRGSQNEAGPALRYDMEGRNLSAPFIAGRRIAGADDAGVAPALSRQIAESLGAPASGASRSGPLLKGDAGRYHKTADGRFISYDKSLPPAVQDRIVSHEVGHAIDDLVFGVKGKGGSKIPLDGLSKELAAVYEQLNTSWRTSPGKGATPEGKGYAPHEVDAERMAEAIRAYMIDPNWLKTVAPKTAARIREHVNNNQNVNRVIQFNSAGPAVVGGGLLGGATLFPPSAEASER